MASNQNRDLMTLHYLSPILSLLNTKFIVQVSLAVFYVLFVVDDDRKIVTSWVFIGVFFILFLINTFKCLTINYRLDNDSLTVKKGVLDKKVSNIPFEKVQNFNIIENPIYKIFGVVELQVETGSGLMPDAALNAISKKELL